MVVTFQPAQTSPSTDARNVTWCERFKQHFLNAARRRRELELIAGAQCSVNLILFVPRPERNTLQHAPSKDAEVFRVTVPPRNRGAPYAMMAAIFLHIGGSPVPAANADPRRRVALTPRRAHFAHKWMKSAGACAE